MTIKSIFSSSRPDLHWSLFALTGCGSSRTGQGTVFLFQFLNGINVPLCPLMSPVQPLLNHLQQLSGISQRFRTFKEIFKPILQNSKSISSHFKPYPAVVSHFQKFQALSSHFQPFSASSSSFYYFPSDFFTLSSYF